MEKQTFLNNYTMYRVHMAHNMSNEKNVTLIGWSNTVEKE